MSDQDSTEESLRRYKEICDELDAECARLKAEVKRLTKAGNAMVSQWNKYGLIEAQLRVDWHAAKEGHNMWGVVAPYVVPPCIDSYTAKEGKGQP